MTKGDPTNLTSLEFIMSPRASLDDTVAYNAACFLFSNILTSMTVCGLVDERNFFLNEDQSVMPTGPEDRTYRFWFPINDNTPQITKVDPNDGIMPLLDDGTLSLMGIRRWSAPTNIPSIPARYPGSRWDWPMIMPTTIILPPILSGPCTC